MISRHGKAQYGIGWGAGARNSADRWTLGYALAIGPCSCRVPTGYLPVVLVVHGLLVALALLMPRARRSGPVGRFVGDWYPLLILTALYTEIGLANLADGRAYDRIVLGWEQALFGFQPAREWIRSSPSVWLSWVLHLGYLAYYAIIVAAPLALWLTRQREDAAGRDDYHGHLLLCYATYLVSRRRASACVPGGGQRRGADGDCAVDGAVPRTRLAWGAAFPSSHVAVAVAATVVALSVAGARPGARGPDHAVDPRQRVRAVPLRRRRTGGDRRRARGGDWCLARVAKGRHRNRSGPGALYDATAAYASGRSPEQVSDLIGTPRRRPRVDRDGTTSGACRTRGPRADWTRRTVSPACESGA